MLYAVPEAVPAHIGNLLLEKIKFDQIMLKSDNNGQTQAATTRNFQTLMLMNK